MAPGTNLRRGRTDRCPKALRHNLADAAVVHRRRRLDRRSQRHGYARPIRRSEISVRGRRGPAAQGAASPQISFRDQARQQATRPAVGRSERPNAGWATIRPMTTYAVLLRGVNVGGKNKVPMTALKRCLAEFGFAD